MQQLMKTSTFLQCSVITLLFLSIVSCSSNRRTVSFDSVRPADIDLPSDIRTLLVVDRTKFNKNGLNIIEGVLTGEFPEEDKAATQAWIRSFQRQLRTNNRFAVKVAPGQLTGNSLTAAFPDQLSWSQINRLCQQHGADAVLALEIFDTDFIVTEGTRKKTEKVKRDGETIEVEVDEFYANGVDNIKIGLRLYDPAERMILDEQLFRRTGTWEAAAANKADAIAQLISKAEATRNLSEVLGGDYAFRISPMNVLLTRSFRGKAKKSPALERGSRYADVGNWQQAAQIWQDGLTTAREKDAGHFAYNLAVAYEMMGNMGQAIQWAQRAYTDYGNRDGQRYVGLLRQRIQNEDLAERQMSAPTLRPQQTKTPIKLKVTN